MRVLAVGDVCGPGGCEAALRYLPSLRRQEAIDLAVVNGENSAIGNGISAESASRLFAAGADVITGGNHTLRHPDFFPLLDENPFLLRPENLEAPCGTGYRLIDLGRYCVAVLNLHGQIYLDNGKIGNPFAAAERLLARAEADGARFILVDFHAEATSEKRALGFALDGRVSAVFGTHTHVQTADAQILPKGTGYITDLGMTGPYRSILGVKTEIIVNRLRDGNPAKFALSEEPSGLEGAIFDLDDKTGLARSVTAVRIVPQEGSV